jgi:hypothetical protein
MFDVGRRVYLFLDVDQVLGHRKWLSHQVLESEQCMFRCFEKAASTLYHNPLAHRIYFLVLWTREEEINLRWVLL